MFGMLPFRLLDLCCTYEKLYSTYNIYLYFILVGSYVIHRFSYILYGEEASLVLQELS